MTLGVLYAVTAEDRQQLLDADDEEAVLAYCVETIEEDPQWDGSPLKADTDKAWDAIHRCLTHGELVVSRHLFPLDHAILGGRVLAEDEGFVVLKEPDEVAKVAAALDGVTEEHVGDVYWEIDPEDYGMEPSQPDLEYTLANLRDVRAFYAAAAASGRSVIFTAY